MVTVTKYVWDPVFDCVSHALDETNAVKAVYNNEPQQYGGVLSQRRGTTSHYHHYDALGSTRFLTDSSSNVTDTYLNDAWGNSVASPGTTVSPFKWVGRYGYYTDLLTGFVYVRARVYRPTVASWLSADPLQFDDGLGRYQYSRNRPIQFIDPSGFSTEIGEDCTTKYYTREKDKGFGEPYPKPYEVAFHTVKICVVSLCSGKSSTCCFGSCSWNLSINTVNSGWHVTQTLKGLDNSGVYILPNGPWFPTIRDPWPFNSSDRNNWDKLSWTTFASKSFGCDSCVESQLYFGTGTATKTPSMDNGGMYLLNVRGCCSDCGEEKWSSVTIRLVSPRGNTDDIQLRELTGPDDPSRLPSGVEIYERPKLQKRK